MPIYDKIPKEYLARTRELDGVVTEITTDQDVQNGKVWGIDLPDIRSAQNYAQRMRVALGSNGFQGQYTVRSRNSHKTNKHGVFVTKQGL